MQNKLTLHNGQEGEPVRTMLVRHRECSPMRSTSALRIVLPGGSGQVGSILARHLSSQGHDVVVLSRNKHYVRGAGDPRNAVEYLAPWRHVFWDAENLEAWIEELEGADVVINLVGRSVDCRYGPQNRREILQSRIQSTALLGKAFPKLKHPPRLWMNASTATIYRHTLDRDMDEAKGEIGGNEPDVPQTWRFSIEVATQWEKTFFSAKTRNTRKIALRSAMVDES